MDTHPSPHNKRKKNRKKRNPSVNNNNFKVDQHEDPTPSHEDTKTKAEETVPNPPEDTKSKSGFCVYVVFLVVCLVAECCYSIIPSYYFIFVVLLFYRVFHSDVCVLCVLYSGVGDLGCVT